MPGTVGDVKASLIVGMDGSPRDLFCVPRVKFYILIDTVADEKKVDVDDVGKDEDE